MGTTNSRARVRRLTPAGVVLAMLAALLSLGAQAPASADDLNGVTAQLRLSTGVAADVYYEVYQQDTVTNDFEPFTSGYTVNGVMDVDVPEGTYKFSFEAFALDETKWYRSGTDAGTDLASATPVVVHSYTDLGQLTFTVRTLVAVVRDGHGNPVTGAEVHVGSDPNNLEDDWWNVRYTDSLGRAVFHNQSTTSARYFQGFDYEDGTYDDSQVTTISAGTANAVTNLTMAKRATVSGRVTRYGTSTGLGLIQVRVLDQSGEQFGSTATTLSDGTYTVTGIPAGSYTVEFSDPLGDYDTQYFFGIPTFDDPHVTFATVGAHQQVTDANAFMKPTVKTAPTGVDLKGVVSGGGQPLSNVVVKAYRNGVLKGSVRTGRDGTYNFTDLTSGSYKVSYRRLSGPADELPFVSQWYLGTRLSSTATPITVTADSAGSNRNVTLDKYGVISGSVTDSAGEAVDYPFVQAVDADENWVDYSESGDGTYRLVVRPGSYRVRFDGWDFDTGRSFIGEWWDNSTTIAGAKPIAVQPGATVTANARLTMDLETTVAPRISGSALVGHTLTASTGTWNLMADNQYRYAWFRGSTQVGTGSTYRATAADAGARLTVRVTAYHDSLTGTATSAATGVVKYASVAMVTGKSPRAHRVKLTITVSVPGVHDPGGTVTIKRGSKTVKTGVVLVDGVAVVRLKHQPSGKRRYSVVYSGTSKITSSTSPKVTIKVKG